jgi:hypothetical protein
MKLLKFLSVIAISSVLIAPNFSVTKANAATLNTSNNSTNSGVSKKQSTVDNIMENDSLAQKHFNDLMAANHKKRKTKATTITQEYVNIVQTTASDGTKSETKKTYSKQAFLNVMNAQKSVVVKPLESMLPDRQTNSWLALTLEFDDVSPGQSDVYGFYQWLTGPKMVGNDIIGLCHDANLNFDFKNNYCDNFVDYNQWNYNGGASYYSDAYYSQHLTPADVSNRVVDVGGIGYNFRLCESMLGRDTYKQGDYPYGDIYVRASTGGCKTGPISLCYEHQQWGIVANPSYTIPSGGVISISFGSTYDMFKMADKLTLP